MTDLLPIVLLGLSVGLGNFAASVAIGLSGVDRATRLRVVVVFGLFETIMPLVGLVVGKKLADQVGGNANLIGGSLLLLTGLYIIYGAIKKNKDKEVGRTSNQSFAKLLLAGLALSVDNLIVGFSLGTQNAPLLEAVIIIGVTSIILALVGLEIGGRLSSKVEDYSEILSGLIIMLVGILVGLKII
ncbi:MAG: manganese efflux pump [Candidatus Saccharibacteria bacterium]